MIDSIPNLRAHHLKTAILHNSETKIERSRLAELERKERAHDAYVRATRKMGEALAVLTRLPEPSAPDPILLARLEGYRAALVDFGELVVREDGDA